VTHQTTGHRPLKLLLLMILLTALPGLALAANVQVPKAPALKTINPVHPAAAKLPADKTKLQLKREAKILSIDFRTDPSGQWLYTYNIRNTGAAKLDLRKLQVEASQDLTNGQRPRIHTVTLPGGNMLNPGQTVSGCYACKRYSNASLFRLRIVYEGVELDVKTVNFPPLNIKITKAALDTQKNHWGATLKNNTGNAVKVAVRLISDMAKAGQEITKVVPANGTAECKAPADLKTAKGVQVIFRDEKPGNRPGYVVLDTRSLSSGFAPGLIGQGQKPGDRTGIKAIVESISWNRGTKQWVATVRNNTALPLAVGIAGWPMENGTQGMTTWSNPTIPAGDTVQLIGDWHDYSVPSGTRLKVHVLLKPSNTKVHEKIIVLN